MGKYKLPRSLRNPDVAGMIWVCGYDENKRITSVVSYNKEREVYYLPDIKAVKEYEQQLLDAGWKDVPDINLTFTDKKGNVVLSKKV